MAVWVAQCLCGRRRHCILAAADAFDDEAAARATLIPALEAAVVDMLQSGAVNPWCGLCYAPAAGWRYEIGSLQFATMEQAVPALRQNEREQAATRELSGELPRLFGELPRIH